MSRLRRIWHTVASLLAAPRSPRRGCRNFKAAFRVEELESRSLPSTIAPLVKPTDPFLFRPVAETTPLAMHIHPHLKIIVNGHLVRIPAGIGLRANGALPMHTHTDSGIIHIESPQRRTFILADFFAIWGKTFNRQQILNFRADPRHGLSMTVNGHLSRAFGNDVLTDGQQIVIRYDAIPSRLLG